MGQLVAAAFAAISFWPQAGVLGRDLYYANSVDLDPAAGATLDPFGGSLRCDVTPSDGQLRARTASAGGA